jgi:hypothetical protein
VQATYAKEGIYLTINDKGRASLSKHINLAEVKIDDFQVPNKHLRIFEELLHRIQDMNYWREGESLRDFGPRVAALEDEIERLREYTVHKPECWKNQALRELGVGGPLASCTCGLDNVSVFMKLSEIITHWSKS